MTQNIRLEDRRRAPRSWIRRSGQVIVVKGLRHTSTIDCQVLNTSTCGALVRVDRAADVPDDFYLTINGQPERKMTCSVARRKPTLLGVRFVPQSNYVVHISQTSPCS